MQAHSAGEGLPHHHPQLLILPVNLLPRLVVQAKGANLSSAMRTPVDVFSTSPSHETPTMTSVLPCSIKAEPLTWLITPFG